MLMIVTIKLSEAERMRPQGFAAHDPKVSTRSSEFLARNRGM